MKCLIIAMDKEAVPVIGKIQKTHDTVICGKRVVTGTLFGENIGVIVTGVGKVNAACGAQIAIDRLNADTVINLGVAGGLNGGLKIAEIYAISHTVQYDYDLTQMNGTPIGTLDECTESYIPLDSGKKYPLKRLATGDRFNDSEDDFKLLTEVLKADIRDMEGGAIAQVCMHAGVPFRSYKIISDLAGSGSTTEQFTENLSLCFKTLERELENIITLK